MCLLDTKMHKKWYIMAQQGTKPTFAFKLGLKQVGCHVACLSQKPSQGAHMNFMWALMLLHFHFCEVRGRSTQGLKCHHFVIVWALCVCFCATYGIFFPERTLWRHVHVRSKGKQGRWKRKLVQINVWGMKG